jgi:hypothetical protein
MVHLAHMTILSSLFHLCIYDNFMKPVPLKGAIKIALLLLCGTSFIWRINLTTIPSDKHSPGFGGTGSAVLDLIACGMPLGSIIVGVLIALNKSDFNGRLQ